MNPLKHTYGRLLIVRPPVPANVNKAGANYKSEVTHLDYSPRRAYSEWLAICNGILACGGDALFDFEAVDEPMLDKGDLAIDGDGAITPAGSREVLGHLDDLQTGRVFTANGPWVTVSDSSLRGAMPHMLPHRREEGPYYRGLLTTIAELAGLSLDLHETPHRWEGMADVAVVGDQVVLTYTVQGHYDQHVATKSRRSSREGVAFAADIVGVPEDKRTYAELIYPHFHGDTVHFGVRPPGGDPILMQYPGGLYGDGAAVIASSLGAEQIRSIDADDAVEQYAANSRQVHDGVLIPDGVSAAFEAALTSMGLSTVRVPLFELFGKAGGGPGCATLYLPDSLALPSDAPIRFSQRRAEAQARLERVPARVIVDPAYFAERSRG